MPFDGIVTKCVVDELSELIQGGRIEKIFQPENDEIIINLRSKGKNLRLLLSASANYPRIHITESSKENPATPPMFCMLLRKHLSGGKIVSVDFHDYERMLTLQIESLTELGDVSVKKLVIEIMGRHSNIILLNSEDKIIDAIKHVDSNVSSIREIMPARPYTQPPKQNKTSPMDLDIEKLFLPEQLNNEIALEKYLLNNIKGFSPLLCSEICHRSDIDGKTPLEMLTASSVARLKKVLSDIISQIRDSNFHPCIVKSGGPENKPVDFHCIKITQYPEIEFHDSINRVIDIFYYEKDRLERLKQKKSDILKVLNNCIDRCNKKIALQNEKLREVADREKYKLYGELIIANLHAIPKNAEVAHVLNYYSEKPEYMDIPLEKGYTPQKAAQMYYKQYTKAKNAYIHTSRQLEDSLNELNYLESVQYQLENCENIQEIDEIRQELMEQGYISNKKRNPAKKQAKVSEPLHYISSDGFDIYVGKNNRQNDRLTMKQASSNDIWLHTKDIHGSHVIVKKSAHVIPDSTLYEAAMLAAWHSKAKHSSSVQVDYTAVKNVRKPSGAKPGMVIYDNHKTIVVTPDRAIIEKLSMNGK